MALGVEGVLLTGGASRRMGIDKASILVDGEPMALRIAKALSGRCDKVTVLGREPIAGFDFLPDASEYAGPLAALSRFETAADLFFLASCDLVSFDPRLIGELIERLGEHDAVIPVLDGRSQPLCALYRASTLARLRETVSAGESRVMAWIASIDALEVPADELTHGRACRSVNTPDELRQSAGHRTDGVVE